MKKIYFAADAHLGSTAMTNNLEREKLFVHWLDEIKKDALAIYLLGDIFDFWFEYKKVVPRGFTRFLGKICEITDSGIPVHFFIGNHDLWVSDYLPQETGVIVHRTPLVTELLGKKFYLAHGDQAGKFDKSYLLLRKIFVNKLARWAFQQLHPDFAVRIAHKWSASRRVKHGFEIPTTPGLNKEWLYLFSKELLKEKHYDYFVFGHRHLAINTTITEGVTYVNLGDWIVQNTYGVFNGEKFELKTYKKTLP